MKYLFLDTSSFYINIAIISDEKIIYNRSVLNSPKLSESIFLLIEEAFHESNINTTDPGKIFIVNGPGSFTGVRVGVTIAKTMAWALKIPIVTLSTLELYATTEVEGKFLIPFIKDRNDYLYAGIYDNLLNNYMEDRFLHIDELSQKLSKSNQYVFVGYDEIDTAYEVIKPELNILKIIGKHLDDEIIDPHHVNPNYLKKIDAEINLEKKLNDSKDK
ncbi:MAG: tRNA (adenosine(37)-N6)-threonylcarbamoyltransferase complex dimerization subunit type 1 TsaB [Bacilli bacterium]|nr:tRNA (adenosine(37)-N6)-threonylcarbamoyltransferase complex dimerization subunit type 1 TsaB [Bacilli bacterium]